MIKLSIIIPTKDRMDKLLVIVQGLLCTPFADFELVISDNSTEKPRLPNWIVSDKRVVYQYHKSEMSMRDNCSAAISMSSGEFITMIGDDDFVRVGRTFEVIRNLEDANLDFALSPENTFYWPYLRRRIYGSRAYGFEHKYKQNNARHVFPKRELKRVLSLGGCSIGNMPRLYQGLVRRRYVEQIISETGTIFNGPMPDMSSSIGLALVTQRGYLAPRPFIINGVSGGSGGGKGAAGKHSGLISDAYGLSEIDKQNWPALIRPLWTGGTVWAASLVSSLESFKRQDLIANINMKAVDGYLLAFNAVLFARHIGMRSVSIEAILITGMYILKRLFMMMRNLTHYTMLFLGLKKRFKDICEYSKEND